MDSDQYQFRGRASLQRYDRPAQSLAELMAVPPADFPYSACWTVLGRAPSEAEWRSGIDIVPTETARLNWIETTLQIGGPSGAVAPVDLLQRMGLARRMASRRGRVLLRMQDWLKQWLVLRMIQRVAKRLAALTRYTYRHSRKRVLRLLTKFGAWLRSPLRPSEINQAAASLLPEQRALFDRLVAARARRLGRG